MLRYYIIFFCLSLSLLSCASYQPDGPPTKKIAVLLPLSGPYARLGKAVQEGITDRYYQHAADDTTLVYYDTHAYNDMETVYKQLLLDHCDFIIGPLTKQEVQDFADEYKGTPPAISLNYLDKGSDFYQFGLLPKDEIIAVATLAWHQGKRSALVIAPDTENGQSTALIFKQVWLSLGGAVKDNYPFTTNDRLPNDLAQHLGINDSKQRIRQLEKTIGQTVVATPSVRQDIDMIFLVADAKTARTITPLLRFYYANHLPVYATASVYTGIAQEKIDADLNGIYFCDANLVFGTTHSRLYGLGADAYLLSQELPTSPIKGLTGDIYNEPNHQLTRHMTCGQFVKGIPHAID